MEPNLAAEESITMTDRTYTYRGQLISRCERVAGEHRGRWTVQTYHQTGMPWSDEQCPHYPTLAVAREAIDEDIHLEAMTHD